MASGTRPANYAEALKMASQMRQAQGVDPVATVASMSQHIVDARERSALVAKSTIKALWRGVDPYDPAQVSQFAQRAARLMASAQSAAARAASAAQVAQLAAVGIKASPSPSVPTDVRASKVDFAHGKLIVERKTNTVDYSDVHNRVSAADKTNKGVFQRPAQVYRFQASKGSPSAERDANQRIDDLVDSNLMLTQRLAQQQVLAQVVDLDKRRGPKIIGYRRVIHPELSKSGTCGMCIAASTRLYKVSELMPIHDNCHCTIAPVTAEHDPADDLNAKDLDLYGHAGGNNAAYLKRTRYQIDEHGELGPVLVPKKKYKPRSANSKRLAAGKRLRTGGKTPEPAETPQEVAKRNLPAFKTQLAKMLANGVPEDSPKVLYMRRMIDRFDTAS